MAEGGLRHGCSRVAWRAAGRRVLSGRVVPLRSERHGRRRFDHGAAKKNEDGGEARPAPRYRQNTAPLTAAAAGRRIGAR